MSKTSGKNRGRLKNIEESENNFIFKDMNYLPKKKDYETFENNNPSIKLLIFKTTDNPCQLKIYHNETKNNDRINKIALILLGNNHYIYITKIEQITKYVKCD